MPTPPAMATDGSGCPRTVAGTIELRQHPPRTSLWAIRPRLRGDARRAFPLLWSLRLVNIGASCPCSATRSVPAVQRRSIGVESAAASRATVETPLARRGEHERISCGDVRQRFRARAVAEEAERWCAQTSGVIVRCADRAGPSPTTTSVCLRAATCAMARSTRLPGTRTCCSTLPRGRAQSRLRSSAARSRTVGHVQLGRASMNASDALEVGRRRPRGAPLASASMSSRETNRHEVAPTEQRALT